jgi:Tripartite tricarboxylate transporter TctB family
MWRPKSWGKDHYGALLLLALGAAVVAMGLGYKMGNLNRMGAGFIPVCLGILMIFVAVVLGVTAAAPGTRPMMNPLPGHDSGGHKGPEWRGWSCIIGGVVAFVAFGTFGGLVPATFASVFVSAMGDKNNTWKHAAILGVAVTVFAVIVFHYGLQMTLPLFQWGG